MKQNLFNGILISFYAFLAIGALAVYGHSTESMEVQGEISLSPDRRSALEQGQEGGQGQIQAGLHLLAASRENMDDLLSPGVREHLGKLANPNIPGTATGIDMLETREWLPMEVVRGILFSDGQSLAATGELPPPFEVIAEAQVLLYKGENKWTLIRVRRDKQQGLTGALQGSMLDTGTTWTEVSRE